MDATDLTDRIARRAGNLIASLDANDTDRALEHARSLRSCLDVFITDATLASIAATDAELSEVLHG